MTKRPIREWIGRAAALRICHGSIGWLAHASSTWRSSTPPAIRRGWHLSNWCPGDWRLIWSDKFLLYEQEPGRCAPALLRLVEVELVGADGVEGELRGASCEGRLASALALGQAVAQGGEFGGGVFGELLEVICPHGLFFGLAALVEGLVVLLPGVDGEDAGGDGEEDAEEGKEVEVGDHRRIFPAMWMAAQAERMRRAVRWWNWSDSSWGLRLVVTKMGMLRLVR